MIPLFLYHEIATKTNYHETMFFAVDLGATSGRTILELSHRKDWKWKM